MIKTVAIVGGTHGNEFTGIYLLKKWRQQPELIERPSFTTDTLFANPQAYAQNRRYVDCDLNRRFTNAELTDPSQTNYEASRAKVINQQLGPKGAAVTDFVIDLHTTTSNMGVCLILPEKGVIYRQLAAYIHLHMAEVNVFCDDNNIPIEDHHFVCTTGKYGVMIEVGPIPQSVLRQDIFEQTEQLTHHILDFLEAFNHRSLPALPAKIPAYRFIKSIKLPLNEQGERIAMVHSAIQDGDFKPLRQGGPLFRTFNGEDICYQEPQTVYPAFINEAAYYDNDLAMSFLERIELTI